MRGSERERGNGDFINESQEGEECSELRVRFKEWGCARLAARKFTPLQKMACPVWVRPAKPCEPRMYAPQWSVRREAAATEASFFGFWVSSRTHHQIPTLKGSDVSVWDVAVPPWYSTSAWLRLDLAASHVDVEGDVRPSCKAPTPPRNACAPPLLQSGMRFCTHSTKKRRAVAKRREEE